jgi:hypothetical protein
MHPPGRPNMTSTPSISRLLIRAWAPVSFMGLLLRGQQKTSPLGEVGGARRGGGVVRYVMSTRARGALVTGIRMTAIGTFGNFVRGT